MFEAPSKTIERHHWNSLYLTSAFCLIVMTLAVGTQPLYLRSVLGVSPEVAGTINANIMVLAETLELFVVGAVGYLSDRFGRVRIMALGFIVAGIGALMAPFSSVISQALGGDGLLFYYLARLVLAVGIGAIWPQVTTLAGDYTSTANRSRLMANNAFMMAFGKTLVYVVLMQIPLHAGVVLTMLLISLTAFAGAGLSRFHLIDVAPRLHQSSIPWREIWMLLRTQSRLRLCFATSFLARSDMVITALFLMLWYVYFADILGVTDTAAAARGGLMIGFAGVVVMVSIPIWKIVMYRYGRVLAILVGLALSAMGFISMGLVGNPFDWFILLPVALTAAGQAGCFVAPQVLTVDVSPPNILGSVLGASNVVGGIGIIFFVQVGGFLFDTLGPTAPFIFVGIANALVLIYAIWVHKDGDTMTLTTNDLHPIFLDLKE